MNEAIQDHAYRVVVEERIAELWRWRRWYRAHPHTLDWPVRWDNLNELRQLVKLVRKARRVSAAAPDPITAALAYHDWQAAGPVA